jgi:hypothetical protein
MTGPHQGELRREKKAILVMFPGRDIPGVDMGGGWFLYDILGGDMWYNQKLGEMRLTMSTYIKKIAEKYGLTDCKPTHSPSSPEKQLLNTSATVVEFPFREIVGCLQWVSVVARPDITQPTNTLARLVSKPVTRPLVNAAKKVLKYLVTTPDEGLHYSKEREKEFCDIYAELIGSSGVPEFNLFSDASFGSCSVTFRSTSGSVLYYRGVPILWRSNRQSVRSYSTAEAEFIAASDSIIMSQGVGFRNFFAVVEEEKIFLDSKSAIAIASASDVRSKCRHFALRFHRVREEARRLVFAPTNLQKADALTKQTTSAQRSLILHHNPAPIMDELDDGDEEEDVSLFWCVAIPSFRGGEC